MTIVARMLTQEHGPTTRDRLPATHRV